MLVASVYHVSYYSRHRLPRMGQHFLISRTARTLSVRLVTRIPDEEAHDTFRHISFGFHGGEPYCSDCGRSKVFVFSEPPSQEKRAGCLKKFAGTLFQFPRLSCHDRPSSPVSEKRAQA